MTLSHLREFATNANYASGPSAGSPTKVDPVTDANGFVPGVGIAAAHLNYLFNGLSRLSIRSQTALALQARFQYSSTSEQQIVAVEHNTQDGKVLTVRAGSNNAVLALENGTSVLSTLASVTSSVKGIARNPTSGRVVVVGTGGALNAYSDNFGGSWTAGGALGGTPSDVVWNPTHSRFQCARDSTSAMFSSDATSWSSATVSLDSAASGIALFSNGNAIIAGLDNGDGNDPAFSVSTNGGTSWVDTFGTVANPNSYSAGGWVCGNNGATIWYVGRVSNTLVVSGCSDTVGALWSTLATLTPASGYTLSGQPRIWADQRRNLLVVACNTSGSDTLIWASVDRGNNWIGPVSVFAATVHQLAVAGGRLWYSNGTSVFASDGVGTT